MILPVNKVTVGTTYSEKFYKVKNLKLASQFLTSDSITLVKINENDYAMLGNDNIAQLYENANFNTGDDRYKDINLFAFYDEMPRICLSISILLNCD